MINDVISIVYPFRLSIFYFIFYSTINDVIRFVYFSVV